MVKHCCRAMKKKEREKFLRIIGERLKRKARAKYKFCNLYVKHLPDDFDKEKLLQMFGPFGAIRSARILRSKLKEDPKFKFIKRTSVFAFVCFLDPEEAKEAKTKLNGKVCIKKGPRLFVDYHQTKRERAHFLKLLMMKKYDVEPTPKGQIPLIYGQFIPENEAPLTNPPAQMNLIPAQGY